MYLPLVTMFNNLMFGSLRSYNRRDVLTTYSNLGKLHLQTKNYEKAIHVYKDLLRMLERELGGHSKEVSQVLILMTDAYEAMGDLVMALDTLNAAKKIMSTDVVMNRIAKITQDLESNAEPTNTDPKQL